MIRVDRFWDGDSITGDEPPTRQYAVEVEKNLDRAACELVRQAQICKTGDLTAALGPHPTGDRVSYFYGEGSARTMVFKNLYCVKVGEKPPQH